LSIFIGFLLSLGSTSLVSNIISGIVLTYTRGLRIGDRVQIGDAVGDVVDRNLLVTRIRTIKNVVITIPNGMVLNNHIINYSSNVPEQGLILNTSVTIGYDVPWRQGISFNLIHKQTMFKVDIFPARDRAYDRAQFERRAAYTLAEESGQTAYVASPEDNILSKLERYRLGGEISDRQWQDVLNVLKIQGERIDRSYLEYWGGQLGLSDLLARALEERT